jgi:DNA-directed RNA polymerase subunit M
MEKSTAAQNAVMCIGDHTMKYCPRCGSSNIGWPLPYDRQKWECKDCGYIGSLIVEDGEIAEEIRKDYIQKKYKER